MWEVALSLASGKPSTFRRLYSAKPPTAMPTHHNLIKLVNNYYDLQIANYLHYHVVHQWLASSMQGLRYICSFKILWDFYLPKPDPGLNSPEKESFAIVAAMATWGHQWQRKKILIYCDNQAIVQVWQAKNTKHPAIAQVCHTLFLLAAKIILMSPYNT